ncbi:hypothetical protein Spb1_19620 [Planctopirus ephydatiae]|uniref:Uncharacterized protein n=1 Tax=Planctopirus ephydatiae TaxID=2528019 RepID=A0A518GN07_9PLAN|nr:hypothetical protein [Planctopirus ephydatiae]QDV30035.1 hypothetical protein Spb1_19620 [Planctopirus ephydatiae]
MAGWFSQSSKSAQSVPPVAVPFEIACGCGNTITGERSFSHQFIPCVQCGQKVFVLPANVYPPVAMTKTLSKAQPESSQNSGDDPELNEALLASTAGEAPIVKGAKAIGRKMKPLPVPITLPQDAAPPEPSAVEKLIASWGKRLHQLKSSWRIWHSIVSATALVLVLTGLVLWRQSAIASAKLRVDVATEAGIKALKEGNFPEANRQLTDAVTALNLLGIQTDTSRMVRQYAAEARAAANLVEIPFEEGLPDLRGPQFSRELKDSVRRNYAGKWLIFDSYAERDRSEPETNGWRFDLPLQVAGRKTIVLLNPDRMRSSFPSGDESQRMIIAGQIQEIEVPADRPELRIRLRGDTFSLWAHEEVLQTLGLDSIDPDLKKETVEILERQMAAMGFKSTGQTPPGVDQAGENNSGKKASSP